ncbi:type II secretion system protein [Undibacterium sp. TJN25]|uniref:type II secretion system protein n=1 Tax=Undibacterium sp. TJN25 TaxID=3413056 RepID=UPI003BF2D624
MTSDNMSLRRAKRYPQSKKLTYGFTYLALLIFLAIIALSSTAILQLGIIIQRRDAEDELLAIGIEFRNALISYAAVSPAGYATAPPDLQDLVKDMRFAIPKRHLRKVYIDTITGKQGWGIVMTTDKKGILGIHSLSERHPIKIANFPQELRGFENKTSYSNWVFSAYGLPIVSPHVDLP